MNEAPADPERPEHRPPPSVGPIPPGEVHHALIRLSLAVTAIHLILTVLAITPGGIMRTVLATTAVALFLVGCAIFLGAFVMAAGRSRAEEVWFGGVFFLSGGVVPAKARNLLFGSLLAQCIIGLVGAAAAPFTALAFSTLVPLFGLGVIALYGARWGEFSPKPSAE